MAIQKTSQDCERLLQWAYCDELPKKELAVECRGWGDVEEYLERGGVDISWSTTPQRYAGIGTPHPDALQLDYMVRSLERVSIQWPHAGEVLAPEFRQCVSDYDDTVRSISVNVVALVQHHAIMRNRPIWDVGTPRLVRKNGKNNKPLIVGLTAGRRYAPGAHGILELDPAAADIIRPRFEYFVWRSALVQLAFESCRTNALRDHVATKPAAAQVPWITGPERSARVLPTIFAGKGPLTTPRSLAC